MIDISSLKPEDNVTRRTLLPDLENRKKLRAKRRLKDNISRWGITVAGFGVVFALTMIFVYLIYEVAPIVRGATVSKQSDYTLPATGAATQRLVMDRYEQDRKSVV